MHLDISLSELEIPCALIYIPSKKQIYGKTIKFLDFVQTSSRLRTLPVELRGKLSRNSKIRGTL